MLVYGKCECFVMQMLYVCILCASCDSSQCRILNDLQFVNTGRGCKRRTPEPVSRLPYRSHKCLLLFSPSCCCECFYHLQWLVCLY